MPLVHMQCSAVNTPATATARVRTTHRRILYLSVPVGVKVRCGPAHPPHHLYTVSPSTLERTQDVDTQTWTKPTSLNTNGDAPLHVAWSADGTMVAYSAAVTRAHSDVAPRVVVDDVIIDVSCRTVFSFEL